MHVIEQLTIDNYIYHAHARSTSSKSGYWPCALSLLSYIASLTWHIQTRINCQKSPKHV